MTYSTMDEMLIQIKWQEQEHTTREILAQNSALQARRLTADRRSRLPSFAALRHMMTALAQSVVLKIV